MVSFRYLLLIFMKVTDSQPIRYRKTSAPKIFSAGPEQLISNVRLPFGLHLYMQLANFAPRV